MIMEYSGATEIAKYFHEFNVDCVSYFRDMRHAGSYGTSLGFKYFGDGVENELAKCCVVVHEIRLKENHDFSRGRN